MPKLCWITLVLALGAPASAFAGSNPRAAAGTAGDGWMRGLPPAQGPVVVRTSFELRDINDIDDEAETFDFVGVLTLSWRDERQAFDPAQAGVDEKVYQGEYQLNEIFDGWFPQIILVNESAGYERQGVVLRVTPDGTLTLIQTVNAIAEADLDLRRHPLDRQTLEAIFEPLGFDNREVRIEASEGRSTKPEVFVPQWTVETVRTSSRDRQASYAGAHRVASAFVVTMDVRRESFFMIRLVVFPLVLIVMLSWSVFWMDKSSLGDRISVSFIGILTAVAYQILIGGILPQISYFTLMNGFLNISFVIMCVTVVINLRVSRLDQLGRSEVGNRLDRRCRWIFPLVYFGLNALAVGVALTFF